MLRQRPSRPRFDLSRLGADAQRQLQAQGVVISETPKYGVSAKEERTVAGITFASKLEAHCYQELCRLVGRDKIALQPKFELLEAFVGPDGTKHRAVNYVGDFLVRVPDGQELVVDAKGMVLPEFSLKLKFFTHRYQRVLHCVHTLKQLRELLAAHGVQT
jgi:phenylpropionate dioxygenase-like ring-hydroxylating dioxygenase large terminal subunit